jgi:DNA-directed RNA polymerase II subunit RPB2
VQVEREMAGAEDEGELDTWAVIQAFFDEKGLVRQQLDSFDEFITGTILEIVEDTPPLVLKPSPSYGTVTSTRTVSMLLRF